MSTLKAILVTIVSFLLMCAIVAAIGVNSVPVLGMLLLWVVIGCVIAGIVTRKKE